MKITKKELPGSMIELTGEIDKDIFLSFEDEAVKHFSEHLDIPGFRKGAAPKAVVIKAVGDMALLEEMAHRAVGSAYPSILEDEKIDAIGRPEVTITKIARGDNLAFRVKTAIMPEVTLPDYTKIASGIKKEEVKAVTDEDVDKALKELREMRAHEDMHIKMKAEGKQGHDHPELTEETLPPLDDAFAQSMGPFKTLDELRTMLRENMTRENETQSRDKRRIAIYDALIEKTKTEVPRILVDLELDKMLGRLKSDIERSGLSLDEYLKHMKKNEADIRGEWEKDAMKRATMELIVDAIWKKENMAYDETILENEIKNIISLYPQADPLNVAEYVKDMMRNQKVFALLEGTK